jgi:hypothetical protein
MTEVFSTIPPAEEFGDSRTPTQIHRVKVRMFCVMLDHNRRPSQYLRFQRKTRYLCHLEINMRPVSFVCFLHEFVTLSIKTCSHSYQFQC